MDFSRRSFIWASVAAGAWPAPAYSTQLDKFRTPLNVRDFGAVGDGITNDRSAFAAAVAAGRGKRIYIPQGNYLIDTDGGAITLEEVDLVGEGVLDGASMVIDRGSNLWITGTRANAFKVRRGTSVVGLGIYYPHVPDSPSPQPHPATFSFDFTDGAVQFVEFTRNVVYNAYRFIDIDDTLGRVGHIEIVGNYICALNRAIYLRRNLEHIRIERNNFTFGHWLASTAAGARSYMRSNATALQLDHSDGIEFVDNVVFGYLNGLLVSAEGLCQFMKISENKFDQVRYGVNARGSGNFEGQVLGNTFYATNTADPGSEARAISIVTAGSALETLTIADNNFELAADEHIYVAGDAAARRLVIGPNNYRFWAATKRSAARGAIGVQGARTDLQVTGGWFFGGRNPASSIGIAGKLDTLQLTGATFDDCYAAIDVQANAVTATGNRSSNTVGPAADLIVSPSLLQSGNSWDKPSLRR